MDLPIENGDGLTPKKHLLQRQLFPSNLRSAGLSEAPLPGQPRAERCLHEAGATRVAALRQGLGGATGGDGPREFFMEKPWENLEKNRNQ